MKPSVYMESTIPSFIVARMSRVLVTAGGQLITRQWWDEHATMRDEMLEEVLTQENL